MAVRELAKMHGGGLSAMAIPKFADQPAIVQSAVKVWSETIEARNKATAFGFDAARAAERYACGALAGMIMVRYPKAPASGPRGATIEQIKLAWLKEYREITALIGGDAR